MRTGEQFAGKHEPIISVQLFDRVQAIKAGRHVKRRVKHEHHLRKVFHCANCDSVLTPERQKGRYVYFRCHKAGCTKGCVKEETLEAAALDSLGQVEFSAADQAYLRDKVMSWDLLTKQREEAKHRQLQLDDLKARSEKLTGFLLDGTVSKEAYETEQAKLSAAISRLKTLKRQPITGITETDLNAFLELMMALPRLYETAKPLQKRRLLQLCFSNRTWDGNKVCMKPSDDLMALKCDGGDPFSARTRDIIRKLVYLSFD